jgi:hypothetical protein
MDTLVLSTLLIQSLAFVVMALCVAVCACLPERRKVRGWALADTATAVRAGASVQASASRIDATDLPRAA